MLLGSQEEFYLFIKNSLNNRQYLSSLYNKFISNYSDIIGSALKAIKEELISNILQINIPNNIHPNNVSVLLLDNLDNIIGNSLNNYILSLSNKKKINKYINDIYEICSGFLYYISDVLTQLTNGLPTTHTQLELAQKEQLNPILYSKEFKSFIEFLKYLKKHNIEYYDMHPNNVMLRPGTNDLVISDPGNYIIN